MKSTRPGQIDRFHTFTTCLHFKRYNTVTKLYDTSVIRIEYDFLSIIQATFFFLKKKLSIADL